MDFSLFVFIFSLSGLLPDKGLQPLDGLGCRNAASAVVKVDEYVAVVAHAKLLHVRQLAQAVARLYAFNDVVMLGFGHGIDKVYADTDMLRITLTYVMCLPKWSMTDFVDSVMRSINSSLAMSHWLFWFGVV